MKRQLFNSVDRVRGGWLRSLRTRASLFFETSRSLFARGISHLTLDENAGEEAADWLSVTRLVYEGHSFKNREDVVLESVAVLLVVLYDLNEKETLMRTVRHGRIS